MKFRVAVLLLVAAPQSQAFSIGHGASTRTSRLYGEYEDYLESRKQQAASPLDENRNNPVVSPFTPPPDDRTPLDGLLGDQQQQEPPTANTGFSIEDMATNRSKAPPTIQEQPRPAVTPAMNDPNSSASFRPQKPQRQSPPSSDTTFNAITSRTERILRRADARQQNSQASGAGGSTTWDAFQRTEANWARLKSPASKGPPPTFVSTDAAVSSNPDCWNKLRRQNGTGDGKLDYDLTICGGTLGIFFAVSLQLRGHRVCVVEAGKLQGRSQEWNISRNELMELVDLGILTAQDIDDSIQTEFPVCRSGFKVSALPIDSCQRSCSHSNEKRTRK